MPCTWKFRGSHLTAGIGTASPRATPAARSVARAPPPRRRRQRRGCASRSRHASNTSRDFFGAYATIVATHPTPAPFLAATTSSPTWRPFAEAGWGRPPAFPRPCRRQYRSWHACPRPPRRGGSNTVDVDACKRLSAPTRTMLGRAQERWLENALANSRAEWNVVAQQTAMAQFDQKPGPGRRAWTDGWDGYPAARKRLLDYIASEKIRNAVVIGGDVHSFNVSQLKLDFDDPDSAVVASEFVGTSITSQAWPQERLNQYLPDNPHTLLADSRYRGYVRVELTPRRWSADLRAMETVQKRDAVCNTLASFVVEDGKPGPLKA